VWNLVLVVPEPHKLYPRDFLLVVEFVHVFEQEGIILQP